MLIRDMVQLDETVAFQNDVRLIDDFYKTERNHKLVESYIFTRPFERNSGDERSVHSFQFLERLVTAINERRENRFLIQANYGHGKSHFGLILANYFGKPYDSEEVRVILQKIAHVAPNTASSRQFENFKRSRKPYLPILLSGDLMDDVRSSFFKGLERAAQLYPQIFQDFKNLFWFNRAAAIIQSFTDEEQQRADHYLQEYDLDLGLLQEQIQRFEADKNVVVQLIENVKGFRPDLAGSTNLTEAIQKLLQEFCGAIGHFEGLIILFDEFSIFIKDFSRSRAIGAPLQELLNGVAQNPDKVLFIALSQHEPEMIARTYSSADVEEDIRKELNRIPTANRFRLESVLEDVIRSYFKIDGTVWQEFEQTAGVQNYLHDANSAAFQSFSRKYADSYRWTSEEFFERISRDCFPLHPLTTALLTDVSLNINNTRSLLGFLTDRNASLHLKMDEQAILDGKPNWLLPVELVDYFGSGLGNQEIYQLYTQIAVPDLTDKQKIVLKAILLILAASMRRPTRMSYQELVAHLTGLSKEEAREALDTLENEHYLRRDRANDTYSFWAGHQTAVLLQRRLEDAVRDLRGSLQQFIQCLKYFNSSWPSNEDILLLSKTEVPVEWGNSQDWAARVFVATRNLLSDRGFIQEIKNLFIAKPREYDVTQRGALIYLLPEDEQDINYFGGGTFLRHLDNEFGESPVLCVLPEEPQEQFLDCLLRYLIIRNQGFRNQLPEEIEITLIEEEKRRSLESLRDALQSCRAVPSRCFSPILHNGSRLDEPIQDGAGLSELLLKLYLLVYRYHPPRFLNDSRSQRRLSGAVGTLIPQFISNSESIAALGISNPVVKRVIDILRDDWQILDQQNHLSRPRADNSIAKAWQDLDTHLASDTWQEPSRILKQLIHSPYGYDENTLALLFSAWLGYHKAEIEITRGAGGVSDGLDGLLSEIQSSRRHNAEQFLQLTENYNFKKRDFGRLGNRIREIVNEVRKGHLDVDRARSLAGELKEKLELFEQSRLNASLVEEARQDLNDLQEDIERWERYQTECRRLLEMSSLVDLIEALPRLRQLVCPHRILPLLSSQQLDEEWIKRVSTAINDRIQSLVRLDELTSYARNCDVLRGYKRRLEGIPAAPPEVQELCERLQHALEELDDQRRRLEAEQSEQPIVDSIERETPAQSWQQLLNQKENLERYLSDSYSQRVQEAARNKWTEVSRKLERLKEDLAKLCRDGQCLFGEQVIAEFVQDLNANGIPCEYSSTNLSSHAINNVRDARNYLRQFRYSISTARNHFGATPFSSHFDTLDQHCAALEKSLDQLQSFQSPATVRSRMDIDTLESQLQAIQSSLGASPILAEIVNDIRQQLEAEVMIRCSDASRWIERCEQQIQHIERQRTGMNDLEALLREEDHYISWLDQTGVNRLTEVKNRFRQLIGGDIALKIEAEFERLLSLDVNKARELLRRLMSRLQ